MTTHVGHPLAADDLERLRAGAKRLPRVRRADLIADIAAHLAEAIAGGSSRRSRAADASDADALNVLERLGAPQDIIESEQPAPWPRRANMARGKWLGALGPAGGWAGALMLTLIANVFVGRSCEVIPGGLNFCGDQPGVFAQVRAFGLLVSLILAPLVAAIYLGRRTRLAAEARR